MTGISHTVTYYYYYYYYYYYSCHYSSILSVTYHGLRWVNI